MSSPDGFASNQQLPGLKENEKMGPDMADGIVERAEDMHRQQASAFTCNS